MKTTAEQRDPASQEPLVLPLAEALAKLGAHPDRWSLTRYSERNWVVIGGAGCIIGKGATWPEAVGNALGREVVACDDAVELRAALQGIVDLLSKPNSDSLRGAARMIGAIGIARAALSWSEGQP